MEYSVTRLGEFWKVLMTNFLLKIAKNYGDFVGLSEKQHSSVITTVACFWATFGKA